MDLDIFLREQGNRATQIENEGQFISLATLQEPHYGSDLRWTG